MKTNKQKDGAATADPRRNPQTPTAKQRLQREIERCDQIRKLLGLIEDKVGLRATFDPLSSQPTRYIMPYSDCDYIFDTPQVALDWLAKKYAELSLMYERAEKSRDGRDVSNGIQ